MQKISIPLQQLFRFLQAKGEGFYGRDGLLMTGHDDLQTAIASAQLDFLTLVEAGVRPPIAFRNRLLLDQWIDFNDLNVITVGRRQRRNVGVLYGKLQTPSMGRRYYHQMWVRAGYRDYRKAKVQYLQHTDGKGIKVDEHDVDHSVSSKYLLAHWPDAWVNVLLVERSLNRSVGSMMEKVLKPATGDVLLLNVECLIKLLFTREDKLNRASAKDYFATASTRFLVDKGSGTTSDAARNAQAVLNQISADFELGFEVRPSIPARIINGRIVTL